jgi:hypothetical protein
VLKSLVGDVVIEGRMVEGQPKPQMVARFTIDAVSAIAALRRGKGGGVDDPTADVWEFLVRDRWIIQCWKLPPLLAVIVPLIYDRREEARQFRRRRGDAA